MLEQNAAERTHRIEDAYTNWFLVEDGDGRSLTVVDTGLPRSCEALQSALAKLGTLARATSRRSY